MQESENGFNLELIDLRGSEGAFDYCSKTYTVIYSVGSMLVYWELQKDKKLFINYHESTVGAIKISYSGNYFISIDKNKFPNIIIWEIPSLTIVYQNKLSVNFRSNADEFPEETKFLREENGKNFSNFNLKNQHNKNSSLMINDIFIDFFQTNYICVLINVEFYNENVFYYNRQSNTNDLGTKISGSINRQVFYFFEILNTIHLKFFKVIDNENFALDIKSFLNGTIITMEKKLLKFWKIDKIKNLIKLKTKIHIKQNLVKNQLQLCEYLKMIIILNENSTCLILDETGVFLLSINPDLGPLSLSNKFQSIKQIFIFLIFPF